MEDDNIAANGIKTWLVKKKIKIGNGLRMVSFNSMAVSLSAPENVITPKSRITNGRKFINI
jgi:hypothetical protein